MIFFDEDCNARYFRAEAGKLLPKDLDHIVDALTGSDVTDIIIGTCAQTAMYPGARAINEFTEGFDIEKGIEQPWSFGQPNPSLYRNAANIVALAALGIDSNDYLLKRAREKGFCTWVTVRMNDQHCTDTPKMPLHCRLWMEHPELRTQSHAPEAGFSYEHAIVRDTFRDVIRENLELYDVDGIVLDWMRHVPHFNDGEGEAHITIMNDYMQEIRRMVNDFAAKRGHRIQLAVRIPLTIQSARYHGLDGVEWARRGLVDRLVISPKYLRSFVMDANAWKAAIGREDFPVTACIDTPYQPYPGYPADAPRGAWTHEPFDRRQLPFIRGACRVALSNGSDGIYFFNFMGVRNKGIMQEVFSECGSLQTLLHKNFSLDISYDDLDMDEGVFLKGWRAEENDTYFSQWRRQQKAAGTYPYQLPKELSPSESCTFTFATGAVPEESPLLACSFEGLDKADVCINGHPCTYSNNRYLLELDAFHEKTAIVNVTNRADETVEILRASLHFSWDGNFPEMYLPEQKVNIGTALNL